MKKIFLFCIVILFHFPFATFAQIPGGSILWLIADSIRVQSGRKVVTWDDKSGNNNSATQNTISSQPLYMPNIVGGHAAVKFHGGGEYLGCPPVFPYNHDYTIVAVIRIDDSTNVNNILSGNSHALFFGSTLYPRVVHADFNFQLISSLKIDSEFAIITIRFSNDNAQAKVYVNGQSGDSLYIESNTDSTVYIGAYQGAYTLNGAIAELALFNRQISESERNQFEASLRLKYGISLGKPVPRPDSTFTSIPASLQLYPRGSDDSAIVTIAGNIYQSGFDSISIDIFKDNLLYLHQTEALHYSDAKAPFGFASKIHAELSEYHYIVHLNNAKLDTIIANRDSITCGDIYFICGESNSTFGYYTVPYENEYCRAFGINFSQNVRDTFWAFSTAGLWGDGPSVSGWGLMLQKHFVEQEHIPTCIIDGGQSGTILTYHLRDTLYPLSLETIYGRLLYRSEKAGIAIAVKAIIWYHGELDMVDHYFENFKTLYNSWNENYPSLKKIYVIQLRPAFCVDLYDQPLRELMRNMPDSLQNITAISSTMFPNQDGCHFHDDGFSGIADQIFPLLARDFYGSTDTIGIASPNIEKAFYTTPQNNEIALVFSPHNCGISATNDTTVGGISATIKDSFYPNDELGKVESIRFSEDTIFLQLYSSSNAKFISHIPDRYYNGSDSVFYEGPWLKSSRGIGALIFYHFPIDDWKSNVNTSYNQGELTLNVIPNPSSNSTLLKFNLPVASDITLSVYDVLGKKLATLFTGRESIGAHEVPFDANNLPAGEYFCRLQAGDKTLTQKIIVTR